MEHWDVYDRHRQQTGITVERGQPLQKGQYRLMVHVLVFNAKGQMLIQLRQNWKRYGDWPNTWDLSAGGSAIAGDTSASAASRELQEEIGITADFSDQLPHLSLTYPDGFDDFYILHSDVDETTLSLQEEEVQAVRWATCEEILEMIRKETFIPYHEGLIRLLFELRHQYGGHQHEYIRPAVIEKGTDND